MRYVYGVSKLLSCSTAMVHKYLLGSTLPTLQLWRLPSLARSLLLAPLLHNTRLSDSCTIPACPGMVPLLYPYPRTAPHRSMPCLLIQVQRYGRAQKTKDQGTHSHARRRILLSQCASFPSYIHLWHNPSPSTPPPGTYLFTLHYPPCACLTLPALPQSFSYPLPSTLTFSEVCPYLVSSTQSADRPQLPSILLPIEHRYLLDLEGGFFFLFPISSPVTARGKLNQQLPSPTSPPPHLSFNLTLAHNHHATRLTELTTNFLAWMSQT
ncbi:uncharacterized protein LY79DRAFT_309687 [Colletotrichum navitas]|uniref:Uncharacterized protein n=1 Tax=Colletotrichum navitas TaxID=681940 RepID=A0AAD8PTC6_9PEZI|nr:uncharacterized protein LY79DRAFT_309687 [Colletotrichum navitas]KAK1580315.1 hypothetical protein LY79DRAFT_309687 [Colletotrichum navitas]